MIVAKCRRSATGEGDPSPVRSDRKLLKTGHFFSDGHYGLENDPTAVIDLFNAAPGTAPRPDGHGGTTLGNIDFVGASVRAAQVHLLSTDHPLSTGGFV